MLNTVKGWRTVAVNGTALAGAVAAYPEMTEFVSPSVLMGVLAIVNIVLRMLTTTEVGKAK